MTPINIKNLLEELISIPSPFFYEEKIALFLENYLRTMGFSTSRQAVERSAIIDGKEKKFSHFNVLGEKGEGDRSFLLYAHMDTVPVVKAWQEMGLDPYKPVFKDGKIIGLGASDMKAGIVSILKGVENLNPTDYKIKICFAVDEEYESTGAHVLVNSDFVKDCVSCIVPEVGTGNAPPAMENLIIGRHGRNRVGIRITGHAAHAATPEFILNPVEYALEFINETKKIDPGNDPDMPPGNVSIYSIKAEGGGLSSPEECIIWFDNLFSSPQTSASLFNQYKDICRRLNNKYKIMADEGKLLFSPLYSIIDLTDLSKEDEKLFAPRRTPFMEAWKTSKENSLIECGKKAVRDIVGKDAVLACGKSNADENYIGQLMPALVVPPMGGNEHQGGEFVLLESVENAAKIINRIIIDYMK